jgi:hypothetical protein
MTSSRSWPCDDEDRPSGSVRPLSQADLEAILAHLNNDRDELLAGTGADRPVVAIRVRASVGRPGGSAQTQWRRKWAAEWAAWTRTLPWRVAVLLGSVPVGESSATCWRPGWGGRRRTGRRGGRLGAAVPTQPGRRRLATGRGGGATHRPTARPARTARVGGPHDLAIPGSRANIDHLLIGPGGLFAIDSKLYRGRLRLDASGKLWHGRYPLTPTVRAASWEADQAALVLTDPAVVVVPIVAVHGAQVPGGKVVVAGVPVVPAKRLPSLLRQLPVVLGTERVAAAADQARVRFHAAA